MKPYRAQLKYNYLFTDVKEYKNREYTVATCLLLIGIILLTAILWVFI